MVKSFGKNSKNPSEMRTLVLVKLLSRGFGIDISFYLFIYYADFVESTLILWEFRHKILKETILNEIKASYHGSVLHVFLYSLLTFRTSIFIYL